jgi:hypothetical protein
LTGPTLSELILADDADAIAGFRDAHVHKVRAYCEVACAGELVNEAELAAFVDFLARVPLSDARETDLDDLLLKATRGAAAGRFEVSPGSGGRRAHAKAPEHICLAMPELLAACANGELTSDERQARRHLERCPICTATVDRMNQAERRFLEARGWDEPAPLAGEPVAEEPVAEEPVAAERVTEPEPPSEPEPVAEEPAPEARAPAPVAEVSEPAVQTPEPEPAVQTPEPAPEPAPATHQVVKVRRGGLVGATRRLVGRPREGDRWPGR